MGNDESCESSKEPACPDSMQPLHFGGGVISYEEDESHEKSDMAWIKYKYTFFPDDLSVAGINEDQYSYPENYLFKKIRCQITPTF